MAAWPSQPRADHRCLVEVEPDRASGPEQHVGPTEGGNMAYGIGGIILLIIVVILLLRVV